MMNKPCTYIIFGATGNLARVKLMPALYHLEAAGLLPEGTMILANGRRSWDRDKWLAEVREMLIAKARKGLNETLFERFQQRLHYFQGDLTDLNMYTRLKTLIADDPHFPTNIAFYMSIRPAEFGTVVDM